MGLQPHSRFWNRMVPSSLLILQVATLSSCSSWILQAATLSSCTSLHAASVSQCTAHSNPSSCSALVVSVAFQVSMIVAGALYTATLSSTVHWCSVWHTRFIFFFCSIYVVLIMSQYCELNMWQCKLRHCT